jgi:hypothetical protein
MNFIYIAIMALGAFVAIWMFFVVPAERRHHERKLEALKKKIEKRESAKQQARTYGDPNVDETSSQDTSSDQD